jgi:hypothetical protein
MAERQITITVPDETYEPFRRHAEREQSSVEEAVVAAMDAAIQRDREQAGAWRTALNALAWLDTSTLWQIVQRGAETEEVLLLRALHEQQQAEPLPGMEEVTSALIAQYDRAMLIRAQALVILRQRGEDVSAIMKENIA